MPEGFVHPDFENVAKTFDEQIAEEGRAGAAVAVYHRGEKVVDIWGGSRNLDGDAWQEETMVMSFSTSKGVTATSLHICADRGLIDYDDKVADHWPEFAKNGKEEITVRQVLCHESGLHRLGDVVEEAETMLDWEAMIHAIEEMEPAYPPGSNNGYHALSFGWLVGELVRRVSGKPINEFVVDEIAGPLEESGLFIGLPESEFKRVANLQMSGSPIPGASSDGGLNLDPEMVTKMAEGMGTVGPQRGIEGFFTTEPPPLGVPIPAANGVFEARSLAHMYALLANGGELDGVRLVSKETVEAATTVQNMRPDLVIGFPMMFRLGYHAIFTSSGVLPRAFGHFGFGGSGAWGDPERELAVAMTVNRLSMLTVGDFRLINIGGEAAKAAEARS